MFDDCGLIHFLNVADVRALTRHPRWGNIWGIVIYYLERGAESAVDAFRVKSNEPFVQKAFNMSKGKVHITGPSLSADAP